MRRVGLLLIALAACGGKKDKPAPVEVPLDAATAKPVLVADAATAVAPVDAAPAADAAVVAVPAPAALPIFKGMLVLARAEASWIAGPPTLIVDDLSRYHPNNQVASAPVDVAKLPAPLAAWIGRQVMLRSSGRPSCIATVEHLEVYSEYEGTLDELTGGNSDPAVIAAAVISGNPVLVGKLADSCDRNWALLVGDRLPEQWSFAPAIPELREVMRKRLAEEGEPEAASFLYLSLSRTESFAVATLGNGECDPVSYTLIYAHPKTLELGARLFATHERGDVVGVIDTDADGWPELVFDDGFARYDATTGAYERTRIVEFPDRIPNCDE